VPNERCVRLETGLMLKIVLTHCSGIAIRNVLPVLWMLSCLHKAALTCEIKLNKWYKTFANLQKFLKTFGAFILFHFILGLHVREA